MKAGCIDPHWLTGIKWNKIWKNELKTISRDVTRIIVGLRTGHNHLAHYLHNRLGVLDTDQCHCGDAHQDLFHLLKQCSDTGTRTRRDKMIRTTYEAYRNAWFSILVRDDEPPKEWHHDSIDMTDTNTFLFPPMEMPVADRSRVLKAVANFYRWVRGYRGRQERSRLAALSEESSDSSEPTQSDTSISDDAYDSTEDRSGIG